MARPQRDETKEVPRGVSRQETAHQRRRPYGSVQEGYVAVREVLDDVLCLAPVGTDTRARRNHAPDALRREYRALLAISSVNYALKSEGEQEAITASYQAFLNGLTFPVQVLVRIIPLDLGPYLARLEAAATHAMVSRGQRGRTDEAADACKTSQTAGPPAATSATAADAVALSVPEPVRAGPDSAATDAVWERLARDHVRFVRDLAARRTLLDRRFYLIVPADGETTNRANSRSHRLSHGLLPHLPLGRVRSRRVLEEQVAAARQQLDLRTGEIVRQLARNGLEARRLRGPEMADLCYSCLSPRRAAHHPLPSAVVLGADRPVMATHIEAAARSGSPTEASLGGVDRPGGTAGDAAGEED